jgi:hypothetical protein
MGAAKGDSDYASGSDRGARYGLCPQVACARVLCMGEL